MRTCRSHSASLACGRSPGRKRFNSGVTLAAWPRVRVAAGHARAVRLRDHHRRRAHHDGDRGPRSHAGEPSTDVGVQRVELLHGEVHAGDVGRRRGADRPGEGARRDRDPRAVLRGSQERTSGTGRAVARRQRCEDGERRARLCRRNRPDLLAERDGRTAPGTSAGSRQRGAYGTTRRSTAPR